VQVENCGFRAGVRRSVGGAVGRDASRHPVYSQLVAVMDTILGYFFVGR